MLHTLKLKGNATSHHNKQFNFFLNFNCAVGLKLCSHIRVRDLNVGRIYMHELKRWPSRIFNLQTCRLFHTKTNIKLRASSTERKVQGSISRVSV